MMLPFTTTDCIRYKIAVGLQPYLLDQEKLLFKVVFLIFFNGLLKEFHFNRCLSSLVSLGVSDAFGSVLGAEWSLFNGPNIEITSGCKLCIWLFSDYEIVIFLLPKSAFLPWGVTFATCSISNF